MIRNKFKRCSTLWMLLLGLNCATIVQGKNLVSRNLNFAQKQIGLQIQHMNGEIKNPCTLTTDGKVKYIAPKDWRSGFFPGTLWYLYELTGDEKWKELAERHTGAIESIKDYKDSHDVGFMIYCSFGNGYRLTSRPEYKDVIIQTARTLCTRFRPGAGIIQSWNVSKSLKAKGWICPVIIDNTMNLELLFEASRLSGDETFRRVALSHIENTLKNHFRPDGSCYHVVDYDPETGQVRHKMTRQGYADESTWSRGHAWAIYGFTMAYRYTHDRRYLDRAVQTFEYMRHHPNMAKDGIPYWDMDVPDIGREPRDASSAAIIASALYEMADYVLPEQAEDYLKYARKLLKSLSTSAYRARLGDNGCFLLKHSVSSKPGNSEIDVPLNYADYYFLEALVREKKH